MSSRENKRNKGMYVLVAFECFAGNMKWLDSFGPHSSKQPEKGSTNEEMSI